MFEFVHARPETRTTVSRMAATAERAGYSSVVVRNHSDYSLPSLGDARDNFDINVYSGVEIHAETVNELHGLVGKYKQKELDFICVHGGEPEINRSSVSATHVDVLCHPHRNKSRSFNHVLAEEASENDVAIEFNLARVLRSSGGERVETLRKMRETLELVRKYDTPFVISADPFSHLEVRGAREIRALCELVGFEDDEVERGMHEEPKRILEREDKKVRVVDEKDSEPEDSE